MELTVWTYEGPPHVGAIRVATGMRGVHLVLHAPQGDTYADLLFTMIERRKQRPAVTYTTFQARDLGKDTAALFQRSAREAYERFRPEVLLVASSCTGELIQDDPAGLSRALGLPIPVVPLELHAYQYKENWGAAETFYRLVRACAPVRAKGSTGPSCNLLGPTSLGFRHRDDLAEVKSLLAKLGVAVNVTAPLHASPRDLQRLGAANFNVVLYPEIANPVARWLEKELKQPCVSVPPLGVGATREFLAQVGKLAGIDPAALIDDEELRLPWYSRSVDSTYLTGKRVFIFGDGSHAIAAARIASEELGFTVCGLGSYSRELAREVRAAAAALGLTALITDDQLEVEKQISELRPELVLGTQMERHIAKRLSIPCAVISAPAHVQDYPARRSPVMGFEGANVIFDTWVHPLMMGLEEHLLAMFREDFEFHEDKAQAIAPPAARSWTDDAERELKKIPFFVRGKARRNTEKFAADRNLPSITLETLYDAKAHFSR